MSIDTLEIVASRTADLAKAADVTVAADPELTVNVIAGLTYSFEASLFVNGNATADLDIGIFAPAGSTGRVFNADVPGTAVAIGAELNFTTDASDQLVRLVGTFVAGADGQFSIGWAQEVSNAGETTIQAGSYVRVFNAT